MYTKKIIPEVFYQTIRNYPKYVRIVRGIKYGVPKHSNIKVSFLPILGQISVNIVTTGLVTCSRSCTTKVP